MWSNKSWSCIPSHSIFQDREAYFYKAVNNQSDWISKRKVVSTVGPSQIRPEDRRGLVFMGFTAGVGLCSISMSVEIGSCELSEGKQEVPLCFLAEAGWPSCFKATLGILAV